MVECFYYVFVWESLKRERDQQSYQEGEEEPQEGKDFNVQCMMLLTIGA